MPALEIACGYKAHDPRCDTFMDANTNIPGLDYYGDMSRPMPWPDGHFNLIVARDCLEHVPYRRTHLALAEWSRLLAPGGELYVQVPDCGRIMREWTENPVRWRERLPADLAGLPPFLGVTWRILGGQDDGVITHEGDDPALNLHLAMFDEATLRWYLGRAGLTVVELDSNSHPNLCVWAVKS